MFYLATLSDAETELRVGRCQRDLSVVNVLTELALSGFVCCWGSSGGDFSNFSISSTLIGYDFLERTFLHQLGFLFTSPSSL